jgi:hypothetical protein
LLTITAVPIVTPALTTNSQDALTMLSEPDMQARYVAATLGVIEAELRSPESANNRRALSALVASASRAAARLAADLEQRAGTIACPVDPPATHHRQGNVVAFKR